MQSRFSSVVVIKTIAPNKPDLEDDLHWSLSSINSRIKMLTEKKQLPKPHTGKKRAHSFFRLMCYESSQDYDVYRFTL